MSDTPAATNGKYQPLCCFIDLEIIERSRGWRMAEELLSQAGLHGTIYRREPAGPKAKTTYCFAISTMLTPDALRSRVLAVLSEADDEGLQKARERVALLDS